MKIKFKHALLFLAFISFFTCKVNDQDKASPWPEQSNVNKPWTRGYG